MKRMKKLLAFLLAAMLLLTMIPISASAAGEDANIIRLMDRSEWYTAAFNRAGVSPEGAITLQRMFIYDTNGEQIGLGDATEVDIWTKDWYRSYISAQGIDFDEIGKIVLSFTNTQGLETTTVSAVFHRDDFYLAGTGGVSGTKHMEIKLTETGKNVPSGNQVNFYAQLNGELAYSLYDTIYVESGNQIGDQLPPIPNTGTYQFTGWQTLKSGGDSVNKDTYVNSPMNVYASKVTAGEGYAQEYHVMYSTTARENALLSEVVEKYNSEHGESLTATAFSIEKIQVNGTSTSTNIDYSQNGRRNDENEGDYYYIYNVDNDDKVTPGQYNDRVPVDEITGITIRGKLNGANESTFSVKIPVSELSVVEAQSNVVFEIRVREKLDSITKELVTADDKTAGAPEVEGVTYPESNNKVTVKEGEGVTLLYKLTVTGDTGSVYNVDDEGAEPVEGYSFTGTIQDGRQAIIYVTKAFTAEDVAKGTLTNTAFVVPGDNTTLGTDEGDGSDEEEIGAVVEDDEEEEPDTEPEKPDEEVIATNFGENAVEVVCTRKPDNHVSKTYNLTAESIHVGEPYPDGDTYYCDVTIFANSYVSQYKPDNVPHELAGEAQETGSFKLYHDGIKWLLAEGQNKPYVIFEVTCKDGGSGEQPEEPGEPTAPTYDELKDLIDVTVACTNTDVTHASQTYGLIDNSVAPNYSVSAISQDDEGNDTCTVTVYAGEYIVKYENNTNNVAHGLTNATGTGSVEVDLVNDGTGWKLANGSAPTTITFEVKCGSTIVEVPGEGEDHWYPVYVDPEDPTDPDQTGVADLLETDDHIQYLFGYPDGSFGPDRNMTRAEAAQMFYNLLKNQNVDAEPAFDDVPDGAWYATAVNIMAELGIVNGVGDDKFEPNREITRAEFTTMAMRFAKVPSGGVNIFTDVAPSDWFYSYVVNSIQYGWIEGYGDGTFRPDRLITRAEVTTIVNRMLDRQADMAYVIQNRDKLTKFTDLTTEHWAYYTIVEATNEHNYKKPAIGEDWTSLK